MRGIYTVTFNKTAFGEGPNTILLNCQCAIGKIVEVQEVHITDDDNVTNQQLQIQLVNLSAVGSEAGTGDAALTPVPMEPGDQAATSTWNDLPGSGTVSTISWDEGFSSLNGFHWQPTQSGYLYVPAIAGVGSGDAGWGIRMVSTPSPFKLSCTVKFREIG